MSYYVKVLQQGLGRERDKCEVLGPFRTRNEAENRAHQIMLERNRQAIRAGMKAPTLATVFAEGAI